MARALPPEIEDRIPGTLKPSGDGWITKCVVHEDRNPSLSITYTDQGKLLVHCHAGCDAKDILDALGYQPKARDDSATWTPFGDAIAVYDYVDENRKLLFQVCRTADKQFPQRCPDPTAKSGWRWKLGDTRRVPYRLPQLIEGVEAGRPVWIVEGEKDAEALVAHGQVATCNPGGAGKWRDEFNAFLLDAVVTVWADADETGRKHARRVADSLEGVANRVRIVEAAEGHKDAASHLGAGLGTGDVQIARPEEVPVVVELAEDLHEFLDSDDPDYEWIVEGLLEREERLMITGWEGFGKTTLTRQLAICLAAGVHPFNEKPIDPVRVLMIDCENPRKIARRNMRPIRDYVASIDRPVPRGGMRVNMRSEGVDLTREQDAEWLNERVSMYKPDILFIGPIYKMHDSNPNDEQPARRLIGVLDQIRSVHRCAIVMESHAGNGEASGSRSMRPYGASIYRRWVDFGYGLQVSDNLTDEKARSPLLFQPWKGPRDERDWPEMIARSHGLPWRETSLVEENHLRGAAI